MGQAFETARPHINLLSYFRCLALQLWALDRLSFLSVSVVQVKDFYLCLRLRSNLILSTYLANVAVPRLCIDFVWYIIVHFLFFSFMWLVEGPRKVKRRKSSGQIQ